MRRNGQCHFVHFPYAIETEKFRAKPYVESGNRCMQFSLFLSGLSFLSIFSTRQLLNQLRDFRTHFFFLFSTSTLGKRKQ